MTKAPYDVQSVGIVLNGLDFQMSLYLGQLLHERDGSQVHLYVRSEQECKGIQKLVDRTLPKGAIASVSKCRIFDDGLKQTIENEAEVFERAREWERKLGETYNELMLDHRQLSRGYVPGGTGIPYAPLIEQASYPQVTKAITDTLDFWKSETDEKGLSVILNGEKWVAAFCRSEGLAFRRRVNARVRNQQYWSNDEFFTDPLRKDIYDALETWDDLPETLTYNAQVTKSKRNLLMRSRRASYMALVQALRNRVVRTLRGLPVNTKIRDDIRMSFRPRKGGLEYQRFARTKLSDLKGKDFFYFPLHKEPETDYVAASPEFMNQFSAITSMARDLPAGVVLALKEHIPAFGLRPDGYYQQLAYLKNVVLLEAEEPSIALIANARATVTIGGTAGLEAAMMGKPVIQFCRHTLNSFLPHVFTVLREDDVREFIARIMANDIDFDQARQDGARFLAATEQASFDMGGFLVEGGKSRGATTENALTCYHGLIKSLEIASEPDRGWVLPRNLRGGGGEDATQQAGG